MKKILVFGIISVLTVSAFSQIVEESEYNEYASRNEVKTIFNPNRGHGGYGGVSLGYSEIDGRNGLIMGGRGAWIIGHGLGLGIAGKGFVNDPYERGDGRYYSLAGGYGGVLLEPILMGRWPVHLSFPIVLGAGGVALVSTDPSYDELESQFEDASVFLIAEPGAELEFNIVKWFRLALYGNYRFTTDLFISDPINPKALNGWAAGITMKVGSF